MADRHGVKQVNISKHSMQQAKIDFFEQNALMRKKLAAFGIRPQLFDITESPEKIARYLLSQGALH
jgi:hypothetical protein